MARPGVQIDPQNPAFRGAITEARPHPTLDVALLRLATPVETTGPGAVRPLALQAGQLAPHWLGRDVQLAGYGVTETGTVGTLNFLTEPIVLLTDSAIRVSGFGSQGACEGDSGGPLLLAGDRGSAVVAGVLSGGAASCRDEDSYVRTSSIAAWAREVTHASTPDPQLCH